MVDARLGEMENQLQRTQGNALEKIKKLVEMSNMTNTHPQLLEHLHRPANAVMHIRILSETLIKLTSVFEMLIKQGCREGLFQTEYPR